MRFFTLAICFTALLFGQVVIEDTGSTNRQGLTVTVGSKGHALVANKHGINTAMVLKRDLHKKFLQDLEAASPLDKLPVIHCMKSASFGSSVYITYKKHRSPDLSCPSGGDARVSAIQEDLGEIMSQTHNLNPMRMQGPR